MKKQVVSFLALFGLVFVLSIYYVLLPSNLFVGVNVVGDSNNPITDVNVTIEESSNLFFATLDSKLEEKHNDAIYEYESIVASADYTNEEKETALNLLSNQQKIIENEEMLVGLIKESGYYNAFVEYQENMIKVIVQASSLNNQQAAEIISLVMDNAINGLLPELEYVE